MTNTGYMTSDRTEGGDECLTPRYGIEPVIKYLKAKNFKTIWCPFDEEHSMFVRVLRQHGFKVVHSHLNTGEDFFKTRKQADCIVSNPPFSKKDEILTRLYELDLPFMVILPQNALQSGERVKLFIKHGLEFLGFDKRIGYYTNGELDGWKKGNHFASAYFCRNVLPQKMIFEILHPVQEPYYSIEDML